MGRTRRPVWIDGRRSCGYSAGRADVVSFDRKSFVVECGRLRTNKLRMALEHGGSLTIVPYREDDRVLAYRFIPSAWLSGLGNRELFTRAANRGLMK